MAVLLLSVHIHLSSAYNLLMLNVTIWASNVFVRSEIRCLKSLDRFVHVDNTAPVCTRLLCVYLKCWRKAVMYMTPILCLSTEGRNIPVWNGLMSAFIAQLHEYPEQILTVARHFSQYKSSGQIYTWLIGLPASGSHGSSWGDINQISLVNNVGPMKGRFLDIEV